MRLAECLIQRRCVNRVSLMIIFIYVISKLQPYREIDIQSMRIGALEKFAKHPIYITPRPYAPRSLFSFWSGGASESERSQRG